MQRIYEQVLKEHLASCNQMAFMSGPRQAGKTTIAKNAKNWTPLFLYFNWDNDIDRTQILAGPQALLAEFHTRSLSNSKPILALDEIHKFKNWKNYLKGIYDTHKEELSIIVTGSASLNIYKRGQDSLMGRYFLYRVHPLSIAEILTPTLIDSEIRPPKKLDQNTINALLEFGGFPEPFIKQNKQFFNKWQNLRIQQFFMEDLRDLFNIHEMSLMEVLALLLKHQAGQQLNYTNLSKKVRVSDVTIRKWITLLEEVHYCFKIKPWHKNITRSLIKEPKVYLWDWSKIGDIGSKIENFVASHLLKAVHFWTDTGLGQYDLFYLRDTDKREVDFLITKQNKPWILIEVKTNQNDPLNPNLNYFQQQTKAPYAFQIAYNMDYVDFDFRDLKTPKILPMSTFLSQLA